MVLEVATDGFCDSDAARSRAEEENALLAERNLGDLEGADRSREDDGASTLNVIVEARVHVAVLGEDGEGEGGVEVFELDDLQGILDALVQKR